MKQRTGITGSFGSVAIGLKDATWAANADVANIGARGERKTATVLDGFAGKAAIIHDVRVPKAGSRANMDHVIVSGTDVWLIDTKTWAPGFYWSLGGSNLRGLKPVPHTAKDTDWARQAFIRRLLVTDANVHPVHQVIWPSRGTANVNTMFLRVPGARLLPAARLASFARRIAVRPADPIVMGRLTNLINGQATATAA